MWQDEKTLNVFNLPLPFLPSQLSFKLEILKEDSLWKFLL
jgi:hypothetical protein